SISRRMLAHFRDRGALPGGDSAPEQRADTLPVDGEHALAQQAAIGSTADVEAITLSPREREVLSYIGRGLRVAETARVLGLTEHTVAGYVKTLYRKLNISSRAEAALEAARRGLV